MSTLIDQGIEVCFANPGTSEMPFVAAAGQCDGFRNVLCLFEGVAAGAADGYGRMADKPAATLLHVGSGFSNAMSQLHNAGKARSPMVNVVGDHASYHVENRAHVGAWMDVDKAASVVSDIVIRVTDVGEIAKDTAAAVTAARKTPGRIATLVVPSDAMWGELSETEVSAAEPEDISETSFDPEQLRAAIAALQSGEPAALLLSGAATRSPSLAIAGRIAAATGAELLVPPLNGRIERGGGRTKVTRVPYPIDPALALYRDIQHVVIIGAPDPLVNFAYPDRPTSLVSEDCELIHLAGVGDDLDGALLALADGVDAPELQAKPHLRPVPDLPKGPLSEETIAASLLAHLPEDAIVIDESITSGRTLFAALADGPRHDWLQNVGGAIGMAMPMGIGASIACPRRRVVCLEGDGSAMYSIQALWTHARENLPITTLLFSNRAYNILRTEAKNVGADVAAADASGLVSLDNPAIDWVALSTSLGVSAVAAATADELNTALHDSFSMDGPSLIEVQMT